MLPQTNARLLKVAGGGGAEDYDAAAGADATRWEGDAGAYYQERRERVSGEGGSSFVLTRVLIVETALGIPFSEGDTVTFSAGAAQRTGDVRVIERRELAGAGPVETTRLTFEEG